MSVRAFEDEDVLTVIREAVAGYADGEGFNVPSASWTVTARA